MKRRKFKNKNRYTRNGEVREMSTEEASEPCGWDLWRLPLARRQSRAPRHRSRCPRFPVRLSWSSSSCSVMHCKKRRYVSTDKSSAHQSNVHCSTYHLNFVFEMFLIQISTSEIIHWDLRFIQGFIRYFVCVILYLRSVLLDQSLTFFEGLTALSERGSQ